MGGEHSSPRIDEQEAARRRDRFAAEWAKEEEELTPKSFPEHNYEGSERGKIDPVAVLEGDAKEADIVAAAKQGRIDEVKLVCEYAPQNLNIMDVVCIAAATGLLTVSTGSIHRFALGRYEKFGGCG